MQFNTLNRNNNISFGVRMCLQDTTAGDLKKYAKIMPKKLVACDKIHILIADTINNSSDQRKLSNIISSVKFKIRHKYHANFIQYLNESKKSIEQAVYETCDSLFDVQLYKKILIATKSKCHITKNKRKEIINYCIENSDFKRGKKNAKYICENINSELKMNVAYRTIVDIIYSIYRIPLCYNRFLMETQGPKTLKNFQKFIMDTNARNNFKPTYRDIDIFEYTIDKLNKKLYNNSIQFEAE